jgi:hypothetical protein
MQPRAMANLAIGWDVERADRWTEPSRGSERHPGLHIYRRAVVADGSMKIRCQPSFGASMLGVPCQTPCKPQVGTAYGRSAGLSLDGQGVRQYKTINHRLDEYHTKSSAGVQSVACLIAILKKGVCGAFRNVSEQHLQRYGDEFAFRWNNRQALGMDDLARAAELLKAAGKRLTYRWIDEVKDA